MTKRRELAVMPLSLVINGCTWVPLTEELLQEQYREIQQNFDPLLAPFRKKRKIVLTNGAFEDLP